MTVYFIGSRRHSVPPALDTKSPVLTRRRSGSKCSLPPPSATPTRLIFDNSSKIRTSAPTPVSENFPVIIEVDDVDLDDEALNWKDHPCSWKSRTISLPIISASLPPAYDDAEHVAPELSTQPLSPLWDITLEDKILSKFSTSFGLAPSLEEVEDSNSDEFEFGWLHSLLFRTDDGPSSLSRANVLTLENVLLNSVPSDLQVVLRDVVFNYDAFGEHLTMTIADDHVIAEKSTVWYPNSYIIDLSIVISHSVQNPEDADQRVQQYRFLEWFIKWAQAVHQDTLEVISVSLPEHFSLPKNMCISKLSADVPVPNQRLHTITWNGKISIFAHLLPFIYVNTTQILRINSELSMDDAMLILRYFSEVPLHTVELGSIMDRKPSLLPGYEVEDVLDIDLSPLNLPHVDSLKITSDIGLRPFFDAVSLPNLRKVEIDVYAALEEVAHSAIELPLLWERLDFVDVHYDGPFEKEIAMGSAIRQMSPEAYIAINGENVAILI